MSPVISTNESARELARWLQPRSVSPATLRARANPYDNRREGIVRVPPPDRESGEEAMPEQGKGSAPRREQPAAPRDPEEEGSAAKVPQEPNPATDPEEEGSGARPER